MEKYFEQKENKNGDIRDPYWCFPPMRMRTSSEKRKYKMLNKETLRQNEENLNESEIDENNRLITLVELEEEYMDLSNGIFDWILRFQNL